MFSKFFIVFLFVNIFSDVSALVELPQVEENNILETDTAIRQTTNELFSLLKLKVNKDRPHLKQYSLIHNYLVSTSLQDYTNLKEIAKLTRVDKTRLNNENHNFMAIVNEILNEDIKHDTVTEDEYVVRHIEGFLTNLDNYTGRYEYSENISDDILSEIFRILEKNSTFVGALKKAIDSDRSWLESDEDENLINDNEFWVPNARRIFQGQRSTIKDFPFMASIQVFNHFQCAGSIIKSDMIITAASCLQLTWNNRFFRENPKFLTARVGSSFPNVGGENIEVLEIYFHPDYEPKSLKNNLCILRLQRQLKFKRKAKKVKKIEIDRKINSLPVVIYGRRGIDITIVGWGARGITTALKDQYISFAVLDIYPVHECQTVYSTDFVTQKNFCAGFVSRGGGACSRDIGGPGIMNGVLVGVISFGSPACGTPDAPTVFTKLGFYVDWIDSVISKQKVVRAKKRTTLFRQLELTVPIDYTLAKTRFTVTPIFTLKKKKSEIENEQIEMLRAIQEKGLLKQFVNNVMGSEEAKEMLQEAVAAERTEEALKESKKSTFAPFMITKVLGNISEDNLNIYSNSSSETIEELSELEMDKTMNTKIDRKLENQIEKDIVDIIDKMSDYLNDSKKAVKKMEKNYDERETKNLLKLLYLSEMEGNESTVAVSEEIQLDKVSRPSGIQIPLELPTQPQFLPQSPLDFTYRNNGTDAEIFLTKQDLIDLFSEALREEIQINTNSTAGIIVQRKLTSTINQNPTMPQNRFQSYREKIKRIKSIYSRK